MLDILKDLYFKTEEIKVKNQIIFSLSQYKSKRAVRELIEMGRKEENPKLKKQIIFWLGKSKDEEAMKFLKEIIEK